MHYFYIFVLLMPAVKLSCSIVVFLQRKVYWGSVRINVSKDITVR